MLIIALVSVSWLGGCVAGPPDISAKQPNVASLDPHDWYIYYSADVPSHPSADPNGAWSFSIPNLPGLVNYVQTPFNATVILHNVTVTFRIESTVPQYFVMDSSDHLPATVHLFFEQKNDDLRNPNGRSWAPASKYGLGSQDNTVITFVIPLTPEQWSNVYGQRDRHHFMRPSQMLDGLALRAAANTSLDMESR